jgi:hypothetical protein
MPRWPDDLNCRPPEGMRRLIVATISSFDAATVDSLSGDGGTSGGGDEGGGDAGGAGGGDGGGDGDDGVFPAEGLLDDGRAPNRLVTLSVVRRRLLLSDPQKRPVMSSGICAASREQRPVKQSAYPMSATASGIFRHCSLFGARVMRRERRQPTNVT